MKLRDLKRNIVLVSGKLCSGKGHYCSTHYPDFKHIAVSDIVKSLTHSNKRSELTKTKSLDSVIVNQLIEEIDKYPKVVVDGVRQMSIIRYLQQYYGENNIQMVWLDIPEDVRKSRFDQRSREEDDLPFDDASAADDKLGVADVERYMRSSGKVVKY